MTAGSDTADRRAERLTGLQALRFAAALSVFSLHLVWFVPTTSVLANNIILYGNLGVPLFYVLSAFALMHSTRAYSNSPGWTLQFYAKRFFRIAPLFYAMCIISVLIFYAQIPVTVLELALNITFLNNLVPAYAPSLVHAGWSVSVEALFYLVFPLVFIFVRSIKVAAILLALSIAIALLLRPLFDRIPTVLGTYANWAWLINLPYFLFGALAFLIYDRVRATRIAKEGGVSIAAACHFGFGVIALATLSPLFFFNDQLRAWGRVDTMCWAAFFATLCVWVSVRPMRFLAWAPFQFLGERSYSLYLVHVPLIIFSVPALTFAQDSMIGVLGRSGASIAIIVLGFTAVTLVATLTYMLIERPGMFLGKIIVKRLRGFRTDGGDTKEPEIDIAARIART